MYIRAIIKGQRADEQQRKWLPLASRVQIIGSYARTEFGHGSNVQGLETTATYDPKHRRISHSQSYSYFQKSE